MVSQMSADTLASSSLNAFGLAGQVQPEEQIFVLSGSQLQDLISQAIEQATAPLESRIASLERGVGGGEGGEERVRSLPGGQEMQISTFQAVQDLRAENRALNTKLEALQELMPWVEALSRKIARLEGRIELHRDDSQKAAEHIEELCQIMRKDKLPSLSFANAAKFLGISKGRVKQLKPLIAKDGRFDILHSTGHKQKLIIALRRQTG